MSRKVGILTFYYHNYNMGGMLQAYALQKAVALQELPCEQICYQYMLTASGSQPRISACKKINNIFKDHGLVKGCIYCAKGLIKRILMAFFGRSEKSKIEGRIKRYNEFASNVPHSKNVYTSADIEKALDYYDIFIVGGDQIWNEWGDNYDKNYGKVFTLQFADDRKIKFSYAASTGRTEFSKEFSKKILPGLDCLDSISVREKSSQLCLSKITDKEIKLVVDPVLLLDAEDWDSVCSTGNSEEQNEPYVFCYFLGYDKEIRRSVQKFARKLGLKILTLPHILNKVNLRDLFWGDIRDYNAGPAEFVEIIRNAQLVLTDSYHAIVFSLIYHKPFYVFARSSSVGGSTMNTRITDFLEEYALQDQLLDAENLEKMESFNPVNYEYADEKLKKNRRDSENYLKEMLKL